MDEIFFYAVDPGAISIMLPVWKLAEAKGVKVNWLADGYAEGYLKGQGHKVVSGIGDFIERSRGQERVIFGSQCTEGRTATLLKAARKKNLRTYFLLDHWCNYSMHFSLGYEHVLPSESIMVMDDFARTEMMRLGIPGEKIEILGHPAIEKTMDIYKHYNNDPVKNQFLFLSEPIEQDYGYAEEGKPVLGYTQYSIMEFFLESILSGSKNLTKVSVIIKPHPRENTSKLKAFLHKYENRINVSISKDKTEAELIMASEYVFGVTTIALLHSLAIGKTSGSIQIGRNDAGKDKSNPYLEKVLILNDENMASIISGHLKYKLHLPCNSAQKILSILLK